jgi:hypothetical protein
MKMVDFVIAVDMGRAAVFVAVMRQFLVDQRKSRAGDARLGMIEGQKAFVIAAARQASCGVAPEL